jgi:hypothetical protein
MAMLLLDHPWPLTAAVDPRSEAFEVLEDFDLLIKRRESLLPVRFIELEQYSNLWREMDRDDVARSIGSHFIRIIESYVRWHEEGDNSIASPHPEPDGVPLPRVWKKALLEAMGDMGDWRNPQIVVPQRRAECWPRTPEITVRVYRDHAGDRLLATLENYEAHPFALSDFDPWDIQRCHLTAASGRVSGHPCRLPKHPELENIPFDQLGAKLEELRSKGWHYRVDGAEKYYYIPPDDWDLAAVAKADWRNCRTFPRKRAGGDQGTGPVDHWNRVWIWDRVGKRHWDVQSPVRNPEANPEYCVISHRGDLLRDP